MHLVYLRNRKRLSQQTVADKMKTSQANISKLENPLCINCRLQTLNKYVEACGGRLYFIVELDNGMKIKLDVLYHSPVD